MKRCDYRASAARLPVSSRIPISHNLIRDPVNGRAVRLEVNEDRHRLWDDLALLILEGVAWEHIELELYNRYGHVRDNGKPFYAHWKVLSYFAIRIRRYGMVSLPILLKLK